MRDFFVHIWENTSILEIIAVFFSILQVIFAKKNNPKNYIFGIIGISISLYLMYIARLYAEFSLNVYYLIMSIYGWYFWSYGNKKHTETAISYSTTKDWAIAIGITIISFAIAYPLLLNFTDTDVPLWDASVSAFAWAGMWLMAKRKIENWILLNCSNILAIPLMIHKQYYLYAFLSAFLFIMAVWGYISWQKIIRKENKTV